MKVARLFLLSLLFWLPACQNTAIGRRTALRVQFPHPHGTEFAGYYQALEQGFYAARGLEVTLLPGEQNNATDPAAALLSGEASFAVLTFPEYARVRQSTPQLLVVMGLFQVSPVVLFSLEENSIRTLQDMRGRRVAINQEAWVPIIHRALKNAGMQPQDITEVRLHNPVLENFYKQRVDVWSGYVMDDAVTAELDGYRIDIIFPANYDANTYNGLLVTTKSYAEAHPDILEGFIAATLQGWRYALEHPKESATLLTTWNPNHTALYYELGLDYLRPLVDTGTVPLGWIDYTRWNLGFDTPPAVDAPGYDMRYVEKAHIQE